MSISNKFLDISTWLFIVSLVICLEGSYSEVCFKMIGCFSQKYPWFSPTRPFPAPDSPENINISLIFYSRKQVKGQLVKVYPNITFDVQGFKPNRRTVTITHGFASSATQDWVTIMKDKYLENVDANIFAVNWENGAGGLNYFQAAANTRVVGAILGRFGRYLINEKGVNVSDIHLIGHSLGSHVSAYASNAMNKASKNGKKIYRITGLDPAQPGFQYLSTVVRLSKDNAEFVEAIHSDAKPFLPFFGFGYLTPMGDVDIFLNRGYNQPNCIDLIPIKNLTSINQLANISLQIISNAISCSHGRSYEVFTSSIDKSVKCKFIGHRLITRIPIMSNQKSCGTNGQDCIRMGLNTPNQKPRGSFQVLTSGKKPFCCNSYSILTGCQNTPKKRNPIISLNPKV